MCTDSGLVAGGSDGCCAEAEGDSDGCCAEAEGDSDGCCAETEEIVDVSAVRPLTTLHTNHISVSLSTCHCLNERLIPT